MASANKTLHSKLTVLKGMLSEGLYREVAPVFATEWAQTHSDTVLPAVLAGQTTFEKAVQPLVEANLAFDAVKGTDDDFKKKAADAARDFKGIMSLSGEYPEDGSYVYRDLTAECWSLRDERLSVVKSLLLVNGLFGGGLIVAGVHWLVVPAYQSTFYAWGFCILALFSCFEMQMLGVNRKKRKQEYERRKNVVKVVVRRALELDNLISPSANPDTSSAIAA